MRLTTPVVNDVYRIIQNRSHCSVIADIITMKRCVIFKDIFISGVGYVEYLEISKIRWILFGVGYEPNNLAGK